MQAPGAALNNKKKIYATNLKFKPQKKKFYNLYLRKHTQANLIRILK